MWQHLLHAIERRLHVGAHHVVDVIVGQFRWHAGDALPYVVDPHVDPPKPGQHLAHYAADVGAERGVSDDRHGVGPAALRHSIECPGVPCHESHAGTTAGKLLAQRRTDAGAGPGYYDHDVIHLHLFPSHWCQVRRP